MLPVIEEHSVDETDPEEFDENEIVRPAHKSNAMMRKEEHYEPTRSLRRLHGTWTHPRTGVLSLYMHVTEIKEDLDYAAYFTDQEYVDVLKKNRRFPFVTLVLMIALSGLFIIQIHKNGWIFESFRDNPFFGPSAETMIHLGAVYTPDILENKSFHKLLSAVGLHGGILHILVHLPLLYKISSAMEQAGNRVVLVLLFLFTGFCANVATATIGEPFMLHCGSSGALCGWFGYCFVDGILHLDLVTDYPTARVLFWVVAELIILFFIGLLPFVDNTAHIFGFLSGALAGSILLPKRSIEKKRCDCFWQWNRSGFAAAVLLGLLSSSLLYLMSAETVADLPCRQCNRLLSCVILPGLYCDPCLASSVTHDANFGDDLLHCPNEDIIRFIDPVEDIVEACREGCSF